MKHKRYGKFRFSDYISGWIAILITLGLTIAGILTDIKIYLLVCPILVLISMAWSIYKLNSESFSISGDEIIITRGKKEEKIFIPLNPTLIVSYADVCPPLAKRISYGLPTYMLKGRYAISILNNMPLETAMEKLHKNYVRKYANSTVEEVFNGQLFVYSFVGNQQILDELLNNRNCQIIIPQSLLNKIPIDTQQSNVYVDNGY